MIFGPHLGVMGLGLLGMVLFWGGAVVLVIWAVRSFANRPVSVPPAPPTPPTPPTPRQILDERLARGETTVADYEKARAALQKPD
jgi:uncharacterized membrane protein